MPHRTLPPEELLVPTSASDTGPDTRRLTPTSREDDSPAQVFDDMDQVPTPADDGPIEIGD